MERIAPGVGVVTIEGRKVGTVEGVRPCCLLVRTLEDRTLAISLSAVMSAEVGSVSLVCGRTGLQRYACPVHSTAQEPVRR